MLPAFTEQLVPVELQGSRRDLYVTQPTSFSTRLTLICLHGWTLDYRSFSAQRTLANHGVRLVRFDRRGFGGSKVAPDFQCELQDLDALISLCDTPVILYGVSQGARLALRYAVLGGYPLAGLILQGGHVDGLVVDDTPHEAIPFETYRQWLKQGEIDRFRQHWSQHPLVNAGMDKKTSKDVLSLIERYDGADLLTRGALPTAIDIRADLALLSLPILTVVGSLEVASRKLHAQAIQSLTGAHALNIAGGGHLCHVSHAQQVNEGIKAWLDGL